MFIHVYLQYIRLTPDRQSKRGQLWNTVPWNPTTTGSQKNAPFELHTRFEVSGQGKKLFGDGMAVCKAHFKNGKHMLLYASHTLSQLIFLSSPGHSPTSPFSRTMTRTLPLYLFSFRFFSCSRVRLKGARSVPRMNHRVC